MLLSPNSMRAFKWSLFGEASTRLISPLTFLALAFILIPDDFGIVAAATVVISLMLAFAEAGFGKALIQCRDNFGVALSTALWLTLVLGALSALVMYLIAPWISDFFQDTRLTLVVRALSIQCLLAGACVVPVAVLQRNLDFYKLFQVRLYSSLLIGIVSVALAFSGFGYWSLVLGTLIGLAVQVLMLWSGKTWQPKMQFDITIARSLFNFGKWATLSALLGWFYLWVDALIVGRYLGTHDMGIYRVGNTMVIALFGIILAPLLPVLFPLFSKHHGVTTAIRKDLTTVVRAIALVSFPIGGLLVAAAPIAELILAPHGWVGIGTVIGFLGATHGIAWLVGANGEALRGAGKPHAETIAMGIGTLGYLAAFLIAIQYGLQSFLWARLGLACFGVIVQISVTKKILNLGYNAWPQLFIKPALLAIAIISAHFIAMHFGYNSLFWQLSIVLAGVLSIVVFVYFNERELLQTAIATLRNSPSKVQKTN